MIYRRNVIVYSKLVHDVSVAYCCISVHDGWWLNNVIVYGKWALTLVEGLANYIIIS